MPAGKTFNQQMVEKLQALLLENAGLSSFTVDGVTTSFVDLQARLQDFQMQAARESGARKRFSNSVPLGGFSP